MNGECDIINNNNNDDDNAGGDDDDDDLLSHSILIFITYLYENGRN
jgi:hypothetical protein